MSLLIKNVEMPTDHPLWIVVHPDGTVEANEVSASRPVGWQTLRNATIPVPPHGRLIDADALRVDHFAPSSTSNMPNYYYVSKAQIDNTPTIIEAEPEVHDCDNCKWFGGLMCDHVDENYKCLGWEAEGGET